MRAAFAGPEAESRPVAMVEPVVEHRPAVTVEPEAGNRPAAVVEPAVGHKPVAAVGFGAATGSAAADTAPESTAEFVLPEQSRPKQEQYR